MKNAWLGISNERQEPHFKCHLNESKVTQIRPHHQQSLFLGMILSTLAFLSMVVMVRIWGNLWNDFFALVLLKNRNISIVPEKIVIYPLNKDTYLKKWNPFFMVDITSQRFNYICTAVNLKQLIPILKCLLFREENVSWEGKNRLKQILYAWNFVVWRAFGLLFKRWKKNLQSL